MNHLSKWFLEAFAQPHTQDLAQYKQPVCLENHIYACIVH